MLQVVPWGSLGPSGLLALAVILIIRGDLIPRRTYEAVERDRDYWRMAAERRDAQLDALMRETVGTAVAALDALPPPPGRDVGT